MNLRVRNVRNGQGVNVYVDFYGDHNGGYNGSHGGGHSGGHSGGCQVDQYQYRGNENHSGQVFGNRRTSDRIDNLVKQLRNK